ncbi:MAG: hypothetical protein K2J72_10680 [Oscillospiraceae bacterium]|nr:hypothetical protein [Oscillospiraceae bacterium]
MKKITAIISLLLCGAMLASCGNDGGGDSASNDTQTASAAETETNTETETTAETETKTETENETKTETETETETDTETSTEAETEAPSESDISELDIDAMIKLIEENSKTVGNDTAGYITVYAGQKYEEYEDGNFTVTSEDGRTRIFTELYSGLQTDLEQTAYMFCLTVAMNSEIDGYETYNVNNVVVDGMNGCFAVMIDGDTDLGFKLYAAFADTENEMIRALGCECSDFTDESLIASSVTFDSYRRSVKAE